MPLETQILRNDEPLPLRWGSFHVAAMAIAAALDDPSSTLFKGDPRPEGYPDTPIAITPGDSFRIASYPALAATPLNDGDYTLTNPHKFIDSLDGEVLSLEPGDTLVAYRVHKGW